MFFTAYDRRIDYVKYWVKLGYTPFHLGFMKLQLEVLPFLASRKMVRMLYYLLIKSKHD